MCLVSSRSALCSPLEQAQGWGSQTGEAGLEGTLIPSSRGRDSGAQWRPISLQEAPWLGGQHGGRVWKRPVPRLVLPLLLSCALRPGVAAGSLSPSVLRCTLAGFPFRKHGPRGRAGAAHPDVGEGRGVDRVGKGPGAILC